MALGEHNHEGSNDGEHKDEGNNDGEISLDRGVDGTKRPPWKKQQQ